jgi:L-fucose isomerase-like protein
MLILLFQKGDSRVHVRFLPAHRLFSKKINPLRRTDRTDFMGSQFDNHHSVVLDHFVDCIALQ